MVQLSCYFGSGSATELFLRVIQSVFSATYFLFYLFQWYRGLRDPDSVSRDPFTVALRTSVVRNFCKWNASFRMIT